MTTTDLLHKITVRITTETKLNGSIEGTGIIYNDPNNPNYAYVFTVLHNILGKRTSTSDNNRFEYKEDDLLKINVGPLYQNSDKLIEIDIKKNIKNEPKDFAILLIDKSLDNSLDKYLSEIPPFFVLKKDVSRELSKLMLLGYPKCNNGKVWGTPARQATEKDDHCYIIVTQDHIQNESASSKIAGLSGSGVFFEKEHMLVGLVTLIPEETAYANKIHVRKLNCDVINKMLKTYDKTLIEVRTKSRAIGNQARPENDFIKIMGVELDLQKAIGRVKNDMHDDWFQDPLLFEDMLNTSFLSGKLRKYATNPKTDYKPDEALCFSIPKSGYTSRYSMETNLIDRIVYQMLVDYIIDDFDDVVENRVYSYRYDTQNRNNSLFVNGVEQWKKMAFQIENQLNINKEINKYLVVTDITHFFDNINIKILVDILNKCNNIYAAPIDSTKKIKYAKVIDILNIILSKWSISGNGIPQNRETSSFLANIYLIEVDKCMIVKGYDYYRYSDDIRIICKDKLEAQQALKDLINALRVLRLNLNSAKTEILDYATDRKKISEYLPNVDIQLEQISSLIWAKKPRDIQIAVKMVFKLLEKNIDINSKSKDTSRYLKFCIEKLNLFVRQPFLRKLIEKQLDGLIGYIQTHLLEEPWASDSYISFLKALPRHRIKAELIDVISEILIKNDKNIYEWQTYLLWLLLAHHKIESEPLKKFAYTLIDNPNPNNKPSIAGACLYLVSIGHPYYISKIRDSMIDKKFNDFFTQRNAIVSIKNFPNIIDIEDKIVPCLKGMHAEIRRLNINYYVKPLPEIATNEMFRYLIEPDYPE